MSPLHCSGLRELCLERDEPNTQLSKDCIKSVERAICQVLQLGAHEGESYQYQLHYLLLHLNEKGKKTGSGAAILELARFPNLSCLILLGLASFVTPKLNKGIHHPLQVYVGRFPNREKDSSDSSLPLPFLFSLKHLIALHI